MNSLLKNLPSIDGIYREVLDLKEPFEQLASRFSGESGTVVLLSGTDLDCSRYHLLAIRPWLVLSGRGTSHWVTVNGDSTRVEGDPLDTLDRLLAHFAMPESDDLNPVSAGFFGYFAYDLKNRIENLPQTCVDPNLPDIYLQIPSIIVVQDKIQKRTTLNIPRISGLETEEPAGDQCSRIREQFFRDVSFEESTSFGTINEFSIDRSGFRSNFSKASYLETVTTCIDYIKAGDIYQVNLSQRFETGFSGDPYTLFLALFAKNPAPFFAFVNAGSHQIISTSPERFIKREHLSLETRPIKGTIQRGDTPEEDERLGLELSNSIKDDAELSMIVDLMRNDLGRVAKGGSVRVREHKRLEPYDNVYHLVSIVEAELDPKKNSVDLIRATFPGGSITGCPKIRSMEIIDELEPVKRHIYTGSIGYVSFHNTLDLSIAIRTATVSGGVIGFSVGGGIVYDSDPEKEYDETLHKGRTLLDTLEAAGKKKRTLKRMSWVNGRMVPEEEAVVLASSPGFQYGAGVFETVKVVAGVPVHFKAHIERFNKAWTLLLGQEPLDITWKDIVERLIAKNNLSSRTAAVKLIGALGGGEAGTPPCFLAAFTKPYVHRLEVLKKRGLDLVTYPFSRQTPLADFKTMNYLYYFLAGRYAGDHHGDEALILNPDGSVSETNTCSILAIGDGVAYVPESPHVLPGVTVEAVLSILFENGYRIEKKPLFPKDLVSARSVILTNALMGAVPAVSIDNREIDHLPEICSFINSRL